MTRKVKMSQLAAVIRSKNAGPFELTLDIIFKSKEAFELTRQSGILNKEILAGLYCVEIGEVVSIIEYEQVNAIKVTIIRPVASGGPGDTDVYGAQQYAPLLDLEIPVP